MGKSGDGLLGKISGKLGNVVIAHWKGIPYIRSKPSGNPSNTKAQQNQRSKFGMVVKFVGHILPVINAGFKWNIDAMTERNAAISYLMKNAVKGEKPDLSIDYPRVQVARGGLPSPKKAMVKCPESNKLVFGWQKKSDMQPFRAQDRVLALAYCPAVKAGVWSVDKKIRSDEQLQLKVPSDIQGKKLHAYLAFTDPEGDDASDSVYLGSI
jgi:hypothetical protein